VIVALWMYARRIDKSFWAVTDFLTPMVPIGLGLGRIGNFIGQELWGRPTEGWWGMRFPNDPSVLRHPSQLYEAFLEGLVLFAILFWFSSKPRARGVVSGLFLVFYGLFRFAVEFVRLPDDHLKDQLLFGWMTRGQQLCLPMLVGGAALIVWGVWAQKKRDQTSQS
jgi:phosphatidylglycerol:prolipoprotein diacylglycerol transferase